MITTKNNIQEIFNSIKTLGSEEKREFLRELCKKDLFFLSEGILRNINSEPVPLDWEFHGDISRWLQDTKKRRKMLMAPRGHLKSSLANRNYLIWRIINDPSITCLIVSATLDNAKKKLRAIQDIFENNEMFRWLFPEVIPKTFGQNWSQTQMLVPRKSSDAEMTVEVQGYESELTSRHYQMLLFDDVVGKENSATREQIKKVINFYTQSLQLLKKPYGEVMVIGTMWSWGDLHDHIIENLYDEYDIYVRSVWKNDRFIKDEESKKYKWVSLGDKEPVAPGLFDMDAIEALKKEIIADPLQGHSTWMAQYELKIVDEAAAIFPRSAMQEYDMRFDLADLAGKKLAFSLSLDPAVSEEAQADKSAFVVKTEDELGVWYPVYVFAKRGMREEDIVEKYVELLREYPIDICTIETIGFQRNLKYAIEKKCEQEKIYLPFFKLPSGHSSASKKNSDMKIRGLAPLYNTGKIKFLRSDEATEELLDQLWRFPKSNYDDIVDSLSQHLHLPVHPTRVWIKKAGEEDLNKIKNKNLDRYGRKVPDIKSVGLYV